MYDWGSQGGFMANALGGGNNLQQWGGGGSVQQPFTGMPNQSVWQPMPNQATYGSGGQAQPRRPQIQMPQPTPQANFAGQVAPVQQAAQPTQAQPQPQENTQQAPPRGPFIAGQVMGAGNVDMLQKNKLGQSPSGGNLGGGFLSGSSY